MRAIVDASEGVLGAAADSYKINVEVMKADGSWEDLTSDTGGWDWVDSVRIRDGVEDTTASAEIALVREIDRFSVAPMMEGAAPNRGYAFGTGTYSPLLAVTRQVRVSVARAPADQDAIDPNLWVSVFHGVIDRLDWAGDQVTLECRDLAGPIQDSYIEEERVYGLTGLYATKTGCRIWASNTVYTVGQLVIPSVANGRFYKVTAAGTSPYAGEPTWPTTVGLSVSVGALTLICEGLTDDVNGQPVEYVIQALLNDHFTGGTAPTLEVATIPTPPDWAVTGFIQKREPLLSAIRALAIQFGWDVRYKWNTTAWDWKLTLWAPDRTATIASHTFGPEDYWEITQLGVDVATIRNVWRGVYSDINDLASDGKTHPRKAMTVEDAASVALYGRRFAEAAEEATSGLNTSTEMADFLAACLADTKDPTIDKSITMPLFPWADLADLYVFQANGRHYDSDQTLAVVAWEHALVAGNGSVEGTTTLQVRGKPSLGWKTWINVLAIPGNAQAHQLQVYDKGFALSVDQTVGGAQVTADAGERGNALWDGAEMHISQASGFTPSESTFVGLAKSTKFLLAHLEPGAIYYARGVPRSMNRGRPILGEPSKQVAFTAGYVEPRHLNPSAGMVQAPANGSFEDIRPDGTPYHWTFTAPRGFDESFQVQDGVAGDGIRSLLFSGGAAAFGVAMAHSALFPMRTDDSRGAILKVRTYADADGPEQVTFTVNYYDAGGSLVAQDIQAFTMLQLTASAGVSAWSQVQVLLHPPDEVAQAQVVISDNANGIEFMVDGVQVEPLPPSTFSALTVTGAATVGGALTADTLEASTSIHSNGDLTADGNLSIGGDLDIAGGISPQEGWNDVGTLGKPAFQNFWTNYNTATHDRVSYFKDKNGIVHIKGFVRSGTTGTVIFNLPAGYRPSLMIHAPGWSNVNPAMFRIYANGNVEHGAGGNGWFSVHWSFRADN